MLYKWSDTMQTGKSNQWETSNVLFLYLGVVHINIGHVDVFT